MVEFALEKNFASTFLLELKLELGSSSPAKAK
jgi:hypothetical protein